MCRMCSGSSDAMPFGHILFCFFWDLMQRNINCFGFIQCCLFHVCLPLYMCGMPFNVRDMFLYRFPPQMDIWRMPNLLYLNLEGNRLECLPEDIGGLRESLGVPLCRAGLVMRCSSFFIICCVLEVAQRHEWRCQDLLPSPIPCTAISIWLTVRKPQCHLLLLSGF